MKQDKQIDIFNLVKEMRKQRHFMVQTLVSVDIYSANDTYLLHEVRNAQLISCYDAVVTFL